MDLVFDALDEIARDFEIHICLEQRHAHFAQGIETLSSEIFPRPRKLRKAFCSFELRLSNMSVMYAALAKSEARNWNRIRAENVLVSCQITLDLPAGRFRIGSLSLLTQTTE